MVSPRAEDSRDADVLLGVRGVLGVRGQCRAPEGLALLRILDVAFCIAELRLSRTDVLFDGALHLLVRVADRFAGDYVKTRTQVSGNKKLKITLAPGGGWAARIHP